MPTSVPSSSPCRILLVEDDPAMALGLRFNLEEEGYTAVHCADGESGLETAKSGGFDLVILDMLLPGISGMDVLIELRQTDVRTPVLILSASASSDAIVEGLRNGADDYLTKPFELDVLLARVGSLIRSRAWLASAPVAENRQTRMQFGNVTVDFRNSSAQVGDRAVELSYKECMLLRRLWERQGEEVSRDELLRDVWGYTDGVQTRTIDTFMLALRKKLEPDPKKPRYLLTVTGVGYRFLGD